MLDKAKKIVLSLSIVVLFALYAFREKQHAPPTAPPVAAHVVATGQVAAIVEPNVTPTATRLLPTEAATAPFQPNDPQLASTEIPVPTATTPAETAVPPTTAAGTLLNGTYTGSVADANWGNVEVQAVITNGRISNVQFLEYPNHRNRSQMINEQAMPQLIQETITSQQANVDIVTGATDTSEAFIQSLTAALHQASA